MTEAARSLASEEGFARFMAILEAQDMWRHLTKMQRVAVMSRMHGDVSPRTVAALERKGIVRDGLLTAWGDFVRLMSINPRW